MANGGSLKAASMLIIFAVITGLLLTRLNCDVNFLAVSQEGESQFLV